MLAHLLALALCLCLCSSASWPVVDKGDSGDNVFTLQHLLKSENVLLGSVDGAFGTQTESSVKSFQSQHGLSATGIVEEKTWSNLCPLLRSGSQGSSVVGLQVQLNKHNYGVSEDGIFGSGTQTAVVNFQRQVGLSADGIVGNDTWRELVGRTPTSAGMTVGEAVYSSCSTTIVKGLSLQLVDTVNKCLHPGLLVDFSSTPNMVLGSAVFPYFQKPAATAFRNAMSASTRKITINSAYRSLAQQLLLYQWYLTNRCSIGLAAKPGTSNHESGLAFDCNDGSTWKDYFPKYSFRWLGSSDPPHYDYVGSGAIEIRPSSTKAFQKLWNANNPNDKIAEDGIYGPDTEKRLLKSPVNGFPNSVKC